MIFLAFSTLDVKLIITLIGSSVERRFEDRVTIFAKIKKRTPKMNKMLSYRRETALQGAL